VPKYHLSDLPLIDSGSSPTGPQKQIPLSDAGGLTQFGAWIVELPPQSRTSIPHWHAREDELIQVLEGYPTLIEGNEEHELGPGAICAYPAGLALAHSFENCSDSHVKLLVIGTRSGKDVIIYPNAGLTLTIDDSAGTNEFRDNAGKLVSNPYDQ
jgi:uncharacterized cupin superfamily protein